jgi:hypothetical protein
MEVEVSRTVSFVTGIGRKITVRGWPRQKCEPLLEK